MAFLRRLLCGRSGDDEGSWAGERERDVDAELDWLAERVADACIEDMLKLTEALSKRRPGEPLYHYLRAGLLALTGREEEAIKELDEAIRLDPSNPEYRYEKAEMLYSLRRLDEALWREPDRLEYRALRAFALDGVGNYEGALGELEKALDLHYYKTTTGTTPSTRPISSGPARRLRA